MANERTIKVTNIEPTDSSDQFVNAPDIKLEDNPKAGTIHAAVAAVGNAPNDTDDLPEGATNLYHTDQRVTGNADVAANTAARHTQNSDTKLAEGTANEVGAGELRVLLDNPQGENIVQSTADLTALIAPVGSFARTREFRAGTQSGGATYKLLAAGTLTEGNAGMFEGATYFVSSAGEWFLYPDDVVQCERVGAQAGEPAIDNGYYVNIARSYASLYAKELTLSGGDFYITTPIDLGGFKLTGAGTKGDSAAAGRTRILPQSSLAGVTTMKYAISVSTLSQLRDLGVKGDYQVDYGVIVRGSRPVLDNIEIGTCRVSCFLFDKTQNGIYQNLFGQLSGAVFTLANGARNNYFIGCSGEINEEFYEPPATLVPPAPELEDTNLIVFDMDTDNPDYTANYVGGGNGRNHFFGGIMERSPCAIKIKSTGALNFENNYFYGTELGAGYTGSRGIVDSTDANFRFITFLNCSFFTPEGGTVPFTTNPNGNAGMLRFIGTPAINGSQSLYDFGFQHPHDLHNLYYADTDSGDFETLAYSSGGPTSITDNGDGTFTIIGDGTNRGQVFRPAGNGVYGNNQTAKWIVGNGKVLDWAINVNSLDAGTLNVYLVKDASPWRLLIASISAAGLYTGSYRLPQDGTMQMLVSPQGSPAGQATFSSISLKFR